jgi:lipoprotein LprG
MSYAVRRTLATSAAALLLSVTACSDEGGSEGEEETPSPEDRLADAKALIDDAPSVDFTIVTKTLPSGINGLLEADGSGTNAPAFDGIARVSVRGAPVDAEVISVDGTVHAKVGFVPTFVELDPATIGAPDPADFFDTEEGVSSLLVATDDLEEGEAERDGEEVLTTITGTLQGELLKALLPTADEAGTFDVTYRLTEEDVLTGIEVTGPFYAGSDDVTYDLTIDPSDESVEITAP